MAAEAGHRRAWAEVDLGAFRHNVGALAAIAAPSKLCVVVKADAYGHSAVGVASAAVESGAAELAVALVDEGAELRRAGITSPVLVLSEPDDDSVAVAIDLGLTPTLYTRGGVECARRAAKRLGAGERRPPIGVEVKVDTGMHRVGALPSELADLVANVVAAPELAFGGLWTHFAVADEPGDDFTSVQIARFEAARAELRRAGLPEPARVHAANSAGTIAWPVSRYDLVRCGIACYGHAPSAAVAPALERELARVGEGPLRPVISLKAEVSLVRGYEAGERLSYGRAAPLDGAAVVATVPLGYGDGVPRRLFPGGAVLIGGRRCPLAGNVTMDQIVVSCGPDATVRRGDVAVVLGSDGDDSVTAEEWAGLLETIPYEVVTRIGPRVPRRLVDPSGR